MKIHIHDNTLPEGINIQIEEIGEEFNIDIETTHHWLYVTNYPILINDDEYLFGTVYNSKDNYPLYCYNHNTEEEILVFDENGNFTNDFIENFTN